VLGTVCLVLVTEWRIRDKDDSVLLVEIGKLLLLEIWMQLELMGCGNNGRFFDETLQFSLAEVGNTNCFGLAGLDKFLQCLVCL
jgi:hypothetical protein